MSTADDGRDLDAARCWTQLGIDRRATGYCRVTFDHPPTNAITAATLRELVELVGLIDEDPDLNVVVFASANPRCYLDHFDADVVAALREDPLRWPELLARLSRAPVVSIASVRGKACGAGREFVLACDLRLASRERLDDEVDQIALRLAVLDHAVIPRVKRYLDRYGRSAGVNRRVRGAP